MLSGYQRKMYYIRNTGSRMFTEAYFVLRAGAESGIAEADLAAEADRIIREKFPTGRRRWRRPKHLTAIMFGIGVAVGAIAVRLLI